jgi:outer membrane protein OmpA-like peptidoglycan-associated protein
MRRLTVPLSLNVLLLSLLLWPVSPLVGQSPSTVVQSVETRWDGVYADLMEVSRTGPNELTVKWRYRNTGGEEFTFPHLSNLVGETTVFDPAGKTVYGVVKDPDGKIVGSTTLNDINGGKGVDAGGSQNHWAKVEAPAEGTAAVTVLIPGALPAEGVALEAKGETASPLTAPAKALATQEAEQPGVVVEALEAKRVPGGMLNVVWRYRNTGTEHYSFPHLSNQVVGAYVIAPKSRKKYEVVKDKSGEWLSGSTLGMGATSSGEALEPGKTLTVWAKFPAPPDDEQTISLTVPGAPPFDNLPVAGAAAGSSQAGASVAGDVTGLDQTLKELGAKVTDTEIKIELAADVLFDFDKADIKKEAEPSLQKVAAVLKAYPKSTVRIEGHTDGKGEDVYNQKLSEQRASAVAKWLSAQAQIPAGNLQTKGLGETKPVEPNEKPDGSDNPEGRAKNRRVEIFVQKT